MTWRKKTQASGQVDLSQKAALKKTTMIFSNPKPLRSGDFVPSIIWNEKNTPLPL